MDRIKCFLLEPSGEDFIQLRRYCTTSQEKCPSGGTPGNRMHYHDATVPIDILPSNDPRCVSGVNPAYDADPRWPTHCCCGYEFKPLDARQVFCQTIHRRQGTGEEWLWHEAPAGAIINATWMQFDPMYCGSDGLHFIVKLPSGHEWSPDNRASNCDSPCATCGKPFHQHPGNDGACPYFKESRAHKCWCRHGVAPDFTVDKTCVTCGAGAGSILVPSWHGFLRNGWLEQC